jgi:hypothetical protein
MKGSSMKELTKYQAIFMPVFACKITSMISGLITEKEWLEINDEDNNG